MLLIFFLLTSSFIPNFGIQVNLPRADTSVPMQSQYVTVVINAEGQFFVNQNRVAREQLLGAIRGARGDRTALVLRADEEATVGQFAEVAAIARALDRHRGVDALAVKDQIPARAARRPAEIGAGGHLLPRPRLGHRDRERLALDNLRVRQRLSQPEPRGGEDA